MERYSPDRSQEVALRLEWAVAAPEQPERAPAFPTQDRGGDAQIAAQANGPVDPVSKTPRPLLQPPPVEADYSTTLRGVYDEHLRRLERLRASLKPPVVEPDAPPTSNGARRAVPNRTKKATSSIPLLRETVVYLDRLAHPPLLPPPTNPSFEEAFKRHEPMFHAVFYRKYAPVVREDAKQEALLALFRKWLKDKSLLAQSSSYVVQAAIYGVSNWRKKGMKVRGREGPLVVDNHGKVAGEPRRSAHERWTDRVDLRLDVAQAVEVVLDQHRAEPEYPAIYRALRDVRHDIPLKQGQQASGLALRAYKTLREQVQSDLRQQLAEYAPQPHADLEA